MGPSRWTEQKGSRERSGAQGRSVPASELLQEGSGVTAAFESG